MIIDAISNAGKGIDGARVLALSLMRITTELYYTREGQRLYWKPLSGDRSVSRTY